ncbi:hypothetical protein Clacol_002260 [Clathrus columnatus]|uniref:Uncharacterized protein n=1 Tax=Clathrus columnatus TaxID=1419009 RepID=A0AAV5A5W8_9AGAM|nr:hypothetical protein Clacol_002260 [Clathrus columnatus]
MTTFRVSKWAPANETAAMIEEERLNFAGDYLGAIGYGVHATLYFYTLTCLLRIHLRRPSRATYIMIIYITTNFILGSIGNATNIKFNEEQFIDDRDFPGGPVAYSRAEDSVKINAVGFSCYIVNAWLQDGLLLYRFLVIVTPEWWLFMIPCLSYLATIIMSILLLLQITGRAAGFFSHTGTNFGLAFWSTSIATTFFITTLIVLRLLMIRYRIRKALTSRVNGIYLSLSTVCIESAVLYTSVALIFIVNYAKNAPATDLVLPLLGQVQSIAPLLITLRVAEGRSFTSRSMTDTLAHAGIESSLVVAPVNGQFEYNHDPATDIGQTTSTLLAELSSTTLIIP